MNSVPASGGTCWPTANVTGSRNAIFSRFCQPFSDGGQKERPDSGESGLENHKNGSIPRILKLGRVSGGHLFKADGTQLNCPGQDLLSTISKLLLTPVPSVFKGPFFLSACSLSFSVKLKPLSAGHMRTGSGLNNFVSCASTVGSMPSSGGHIT